jgi:NAD(P)H-dependent nitrite reductase large subunit/NAD(P)H-dependent nitrite reductase small subunit
MITTAASLTPKTIVVIGNGMVGHRFCEKLVEFDTAGQYRIVTFCEEPRAAYDRVGLTSFFAHRDAEQLMLAKLDWYRDSGIELHIGDRASSIDCNKQIVHSDKGQSVAYDYVVLATGSYPFVPPAPGMTNRGVFVYRTIDDLERIMAYAQTVKRCAVIGGGLLGLEAAKAAYDLGLETHVVEFAPRLMPRQVDDAGSRLLVKKIEALGVRVHLNQGTKAVLGEGGVEGLLFNDGQTLPVEMVIVSAGIRPRDELARSCGLKVGERGGVQVNDELQTSDPRIFAIGEVALHRGMIYGLVAPGYEMAEIVAANLANLHHSPLTTHRSRTFTGADLSTKLKLMGVDVASFGNYEAKPEQATPLVCEDPFRGYYKKLLFNHDGTRLLGGVLVGDAADYGTLLALSKSSEPLPCPPGELMLPPGTKQAAAGGPSLPDSAQICSCNNVSKGQLCQAIRDQGLTTIGELKTCTKAGTGCGGCIPMVTDLLHKELAAAGKSVIKHLCEHFAFTRQELFQIVKFNQIKTFDALLASHGKGSGCEICKPAVTSILASLWNEHILEREHQTLQDTNDRFLANIQRGGLYSVVPRVPGGEITPDQLIALGSIAKKYSLYTKITGGQRVDLFGAQVQQLPDIWEAVIAAGMESGHAYGKALRTVKSCVGTTWCRYGVQDSVGLAIRVEKRYRGIRAPHKIKAAVSGCIRECAEAQSKDFGLIATEKGYNLYVCGNGGSKPRHADLLAADLDEATAIQYIDRFLMYYIQTADRLTRTSVWLENLEGGLERLRDIIIHDKLGICAELERMMQHLVDTYECEWTKVVNDPERRKMFRQFINSDETETGIEIVTERGQNRPADWPKDGAILQIEPATQARSISEGFPAPPGATDQHSVLSTEYSVPGTQLPSSPASLEPGRRRRSAVPTSAGPQWVRVGAVADFPKDGGAAIKYGDVQIAVFNFTSRGEWYACQNMCPHKKAFVLSRGIVGTQGEIPKVTCPLHKKAFSLQTGECVSGDDLSAKVFPVKVAQDNVYLLLPPKGQLDALLATSLHCITACHSGPSYDPAASLTQPTRQALSVCESLVLD